MDNLTILLNNGSLRSIYSGYAKVLNLRKGNYDGLEQYYKNGFEKIKVMLEKVSIKLDLGKIYPY